MKPKFAGFLQYEESLDSSLPSYFIRLHFLNVYSIVILQDEETRASKGSSPNGKAGSESPKAPVGGRRRFGSMADDLDIQR